MSVVRSCIVFLCAFSAASASLGQSNLIDACKSIITDGLREYSIRADSSAYLNTVHDKYCEKSGASKAQSFGMGLDAVVEAIPISFKGSYGSSSEAMRNFCKSYSSAVSASSNSLSYQETTVRRAYQSFDQCVAMAASNVVVRHAVRSLEMFDLYMAPGFSRPIRINGIQTTENVECTGRDTSLADGPIKRFDQTTSMRLIDNNTLNLGCKRKGTVSSQGAIEYDEAVVTIFTDLSPNGNYSIYLPRDSRLPINQASVVQQGLVDLKNQLQASMTKTSAVNARFERIKMQHLCTPPGFYPRPAPPACPSGLRDSGASFSYAAPGGGQGYGGVCRTCYAVDE